MKSFSIVTKLLAVVLVAVMATMFGGCAQRDTDEHQPTAEPTSASPETEHCTVDLEENGDFTVVATFDELRKSTNGVSTVELTAKPGTVINAGAIDPGMVEDVWNNAGLGSNHVTITKVNAPQEAATVLNISGHTDASAIDCNAHR